jgi:hypothetical protein
MGGAQLPGSAFMLVRANIAWALTTWRGTLGRGLSMFSIQGSHACSMRGRPASWSPPSGGLSTGASAASSFGAYWRSTLRALLSAIIGNGMTALTIIMAMSLGLLVPTMLIERVHEKRKLIRETYRRPLEAPAPMAIAPSVRHARFRCVILQLPLGQPSRSQRSSDHQQLMERRCPRPSHEPLDPTNRLVTQLPVHRRHARAPRR